MKRAIIMATAFLLAASPALAKKPVAWETFKANRIKEAAPNRLMIPKLLPEVIDEARAKYRTWQEAWHNHLRYKREVVPEMTEAPSVGASSYVVGSYSAGSVEAIICEVFGDTCAAAISVARCESGLNPYAENASSTASGLFQFLSDSWRSASGLPPPASAYSVETQARAAFGYSSGGTYWGAWVCQP